MELEPNFYKNRVCLNVLANSVENAQECYKAAEGHVVLGILTKNYDTDEAAINDMKEYQSKVNNAISVGLGAGDPKQSNMVTRVSKVLKPQHVNQVFTGVGASRTVLEEDETFVNGLVSPTGKVGFVNIATGPTSSQAEDAVVPIDTAIMLLKDMGGSSVKYFPMGGLSHIEEFKAVVKACAKNDFSIEPTGGISLENFKEILKIAIDAGVKKIIPHIYSSIIDKETGCTRPEDVKKLFSIVRELVD